MTNALRTQLPSRSAAAGRRGMVATSQPLAVLEALDVLRRGGHAVDAAVTAAAVLNVVEPLSTGIGGDAFALVWIESERKVYALNGSGRSPRAADAGLLRSRGSRVPEEGIFAVTVPGAVDAWGSLLERFGRSSLADALEPAIRIATEGFAVTEKIAAAWARCVLRIRGNRAASAVYLPGGRTPRFGELFRNPDLAGTFRALAEGGPRGFYEGDLAERIVAASRAEGGWLERDDLARHRSEWTEPIEVSYRGLRVVEHPPNGQGIAALVALGILEGFDIRKFGVLGADALHLQIESMKAAFADAHRYVADPEKARVPVEELLSQRYLAKRRTGIAPHRASVFGPGAPAGSDTVYLTVVDGEGNAVSFINSLYHGFGSGVGVPGTGIVLQNRGAGFTLDAGHPNELAPEKRPYHTIIPAMLLRNGKDGRPELDTSFGVMGGDMQPQGHLQVVSFLLDYDLSPQAALDAPRFRVGEDGEIHLEETIPEEVAKELARRGHRLVSPGHPRYGNFGGGQMIRVDRSTGSLLGGSDPRKDGMALGY